MIKGDKKMSDEIGKKDFLRSLLKTITMNKEEPADRILGRVQERIEREL